MFCRGNRGNGYGRAERHMGRGEKSPQLMLEAIVVWRRGEDSNPRTAHTVNGFQDHRLKPLGHPSIVTE